MNNTIKLIAIVLIIAGVAALVYHKFSYTKETHDVDLGVVELEIKDRETVHVPVWVGVGGIVVGGAMLLLGGKPR